MFFGFGLFNEQFDIEDEEDDFKSLWNNVFISIYDKGFIWRDKNCKDYKLNDITDKHLLNILNFCKYSYRPKVQVDILKNEAIKRGLING